MSYHIKNALDRKRTNLTTFAVAIRAAVLIIFPTAIVNVYPNYFEVLNIPHATNKDLREMGKAIAANSPYLNSLKKTYGNSNQLFIAF